MDDNTHHFLMRVTVLSLGLGAGFAVWHERWQVRRGLRLIGLWSYLAALNGARPEMSVVLEAEHASDDTELLKPCWGYEVPWVASQRLQAATPEPLSASSAGTART